MMNLVLAAEAATQTGIADWMPQIGMLVVFAGAMYFLMIRPQKKREREARDMLSKLEVGNKIVTIGGIVGEIIKVEDDEVTISTSTEKTQMVFVKEAIKQVSAQ